jgi:hypothetical protein
MVIPRRTRAARPYARSFTDVHDQQFFAHGARRLHYDPFQVIVWLPKNRIQSTALSPILSLRA